MAGKKKLLGGIVGDALGTYAVGMVVALLVIGWGLDALIWLLRLL